MADLGYGQAILDVADMLKAAYRKADEEWEKAHKLGDYEGMDNAMADMELLHQAILKVYGLGLEHHDHARK